MIKQVPKPTSTENVGNTQAAIADAVLGVSGGPELSQASATDLNIFGTQHPGSGDHSLNGLLEASTAHDNSAGQPALELASAKVASVAGDDQLYTADQSHPSIPSASDFSQTAVALNLLNEDHLAGIFDHIETLSSGSVSLSSLSDTPGHPTDDAFGSQLPSDYPGAFGSPSAFGDPTDQIGVFSDARGHGGTGGSTTGGTVPAAWTTTSGTDVSIHITWDSSVGSAPTGFVSTIESVANFLAGSFNQPHAMTINIDVGYGEVGGTRLGAGALGESETYLQPVSYSQVSSIYATQSYLHDIALGGTPTSGTLYATFAEAKALGISVPNQIDGYVGFSGQAGVFDFNKSDGISTGQYDFFGVVAHEFSEVMGRLLLVGQTIGSAPGYDVFDLFHYSAPGTQDFLGNGGYFSTNGGTSQIAGFNNVSNGGDAGDWNSNGTASTTVTGSTSLPNGSTYDAANAFGTPGHLAPVTNTDLWALHAVGFDLVSTVKAA